MNLWTNSCDQNLLYLIVLKDTPVSLLCTRQMQNCSFKLSRENLQERETLITGQLFIHMLMEVIAGTNLFLRHSTTFNATRNGYKCCSFTKENVIIGKLPGCYSKIIISRVIPVTPPCHLPHYWVFSHNFTPIFLYSLYWLTFNSFL